ncbi:MAG: DUF4070 domain-containing protein [Bacteroidales bacterium]|nr:DUF4070 domain-containing protein [Bacteroidales bacterium]
MNILLINPKYPDTYWSFKHALKFISKKAAFPPLGLITVASLLPGEWRKKLIDLNLSSLHEKDIQWADYVFIGAMAVQLKSVNEVIATCKVHKKRIVAGGPLFTEEFEKFDEVDHLVLNEAEITLPQFIADVNRGFPKRIYHTQAFHDITKTPVPDYSLLRLSKYASLSIQYSRGCPFNCEFCDVTALFGHKVRTKSTQQVLSELDRMLEIKWKGSVFFVDDNFIGNKNKLKKNFLPALIEWMERNNYPFVFTTEASINLADDAELMNLMVKAGFTNVFIGIETPEEASLAECNKIQNHKRDLIACVKTIQSAGMEVMAGFIVGFDNDTPSIFQRQIDFIQKSGIVSAMVGLLNAPKKTLLYRRLEKEGRILSDTTGNNTDYSINFIPKMDKKKLLEGYHTIIHGIYSSKYYYRRILSFLKHYNPPFRFQRKMSFREFIAFLKSVLIIGILKKNRKYYWELIFWSLFNKPETFALAVSYSIYGYHYRKVFKELS